jgi:tRNA (cytosine38-C5)-methyltransferase
MGYAFQEFLLSPVQFGIPNQRLRYFFVAKRQAHQFVKPAESLRHFIPETDMIEVRNEEELTSPAVIDKCSPLSAFLDAREDWGQFMVPEKVLMKSGLLFG